jgi:hypothetical protein
MWRKQGVCAKCFSHDTEEVPLSRIAGLALGWGVLDEALSLTAIGGLVLIVGGIALVNRGASRQPRLAEATCGARARLDRERAV